jgi:hypothetical protein
MWQGTILMEDSSKVRQKFIKGLSMIPSMMVLEDIETPSMMYSCSHWME